MVTASERKVVLVTRRTRLEELVAKHHTLAQAKFYVEHLGADFADYVRENAAYAKSLDTVVSTLQGWGRWQMVDRGFLTNFVFGADDIVVALGQDGLVANTMKYLDGQPLIGLNPEPQRWDGVLLPFAPADLAALLPEVAADRRGAKAVTMAQASLSDGQVLRAVNDLFVGPRTHTSALYELQLGRAPRAAVVQRHDRLDRAGLDRLAEERGHRLLRHRPLARPRHDCRTTQPEPWDSPRLTFAVREPFPSRSSSAEIVFGHATREQPLVLRSRMPDHGVIFSDGMESDYLRFTAGLQATISIAARQGRLVV